MYAEGVEGKVEGERITMTCLRNVIFPGLMRIKRALGIAPPPAPADPIPRDYLTSLLQTANYVTDGYRSGSLIFDVLYTGRGSGGFADILHVGQEWQRQGVLDIFYRVPGKLQRDRVRESFRWAEASILDEQILFDDSFIPEFYCATAWPTAYRIRVLPSRRKLYFVQDYEPWFRSAGTEHYYAARSYELGLETFTLGPWLAEFLAREHGVADAVAMPFPIFDEPRQGLPWSKRDTIAIYAQPEKAHRGSEILFAMGRLLYERMQQDDRLRDMQIIFFGSHDLPYLAFDYPCKAWGVLNQKELLTLIDRSRVGVSLSFTNISLLPPRYVMGGAYAVEADLPHVRANVPKHLADSFVLIPPTPAEISDAIVEVLVRGHASQGKSNGIWEDSWAICAKKVAGQILLVQDKAPESNLNSERGIGRRELV